MNKLRFLSSPFRITPDYIIAGEAKCGTTSLYRYLVQHPSVLPADTKEPSNFREYGGSPLFCRAHYALWPTRAWTKLRHGAAITGEASAEYFSKPDIPGVIAQTLPGVKIILLFRHPVERAFSDFQMLTRSGRETRSFDEVVAQSLDWLERPDVDLMVDALDHLEYHPLRFVLRGMYVRPLKRWLEVFGPERVLCLQSEQLFTQTRETLERVYAFLGLPSSGSVDLTPRKQGKYGEDMPASCREQLAGFYRPWNEALFDLLGERYDWA
jgi:hypothetical protein